jgi:glycosyltransferase involved in cell wall biosynthesis
MLHARMPAVEPVRGVLDRRPTEPWTISPATARRTVAIIGNRDIVRFRGWLIRDLVAAGHRVVACAPHDPGLAAALRALGAAFHPLPIRRTGINPIRDLADIARLRRILRDCRTDIALSHGTKANVIGPLGARVAGVRGVFAIVEGLGYAFTPGPEIGRRMVRTALSFLLRSALRSCHAVFALNPDDADFLRAAGIVGERQRVVELAGAGIDLDVFRHAPPEAGPLRILLIARLLRDKGLADFAAAARLVKRHHPDSRFQILGPFDTHPGALSRAEMAGWVAEGIIDYLGETDDVRPYLRFSSVFCLPSYYREGLPRTILEAMGIGRAIVTTDVPGCREAVVEGTNGFVVPPRNPAALAAALRRFAERPQLVPTFGAASRRLAEERYDVRRVNPVILATLGLSNGMPPECVRIARPSDFGHS